MCKTLVCPRCGSVLLEDMIHADHYVCPQCDLYLSAWAAPFVATPPKEPVPASACTEIGT